MFAAPVALFLSIYVGHCLINLRLLGTAELLFFGSLVEAPLQPSSSKKYQVPPQHFEKLFVKSSTDVNAHLYMGIAISIGQPTFCMVLNQPAEIHIEEDTTKKTKESDYSEFTQNSRARFQMCKQLLSCSLLACIYTAETWEVKALQSEDPYVSLWNNMRTCNLQVLFSLA